NEVAIVVGHEAFEGATDVEFKLGSESDPFFTATASLNMKFDASSFTILSASIGVPQDLNIGSILQINSPAITLSNLSIDRTTGEISGTVNGDPILTITAVG